MQKITTGQTEQSEEQTGSPIDPRYGRTWINTETGPLDLTTTDTETLYRVFEGYSKTKVMGNALLHGSEVGVREAEPEIETDPVRRLLIRRGVLDLLFDIQALQKELESRADGREMLYPGSTKA